MKACFKCGERKPLSEFYKHPAMSDGHLGKCKVCTRKDARETRAAKIEYYREYDRKRGNRQPPGYLDEYRKANPEKYKAHYLVSNAIRDGRLSKDPCEVCGSLDVHGHHDDYGKPLEVRWLCPVHHFQAHS